MIFYYLYSLNFKLTNIKKKKIILIPFMYFLHLTVKMSNSIFHCFTYFDLNYISKLFLFLFFGAN